MPLGVEVGLSPGADPAVLPQKGRIPQFSAHAHCGQTAAWIRMPLVRWGPSCPQKKGTLTPPNILTHVLWPNGWMDEYACPGDIVLDGVPALRERGTAVPLFWPMSIVATVAHLSYC